mgnify:CR=1 FL=1
MAGSGDPGSATSKDPLSAYCVNLTARARQGLLDPLIGRADELQRTIEVLCRRRKNNPVFVGDAGVGKTAMAEGLAVRLLSGDAQDTLKDAEIFALDTGALLAGSRPIARPAWYAYRRPAWRCSASGRRRDGRGGPRRVRHAIPRA